MVRVMSDPPKAAERVTTYCEEICTMGCGNEASWEEGKDQRIVSPERFRLLNVEKNNIFELNYNWLFNVSDMPFF